MHMHIPPPTNSSPHTNTHTHQRDPTRELVQSYHPPKITLAQVTAFILAIAATLYATMNSSMASSTLSLSDSLTNPDADRLPYRLDFFHLAYALASAYLSMLFCGWSLSDVPGHWDVDSGWVSVWVKMASQWLCALLYGWTLLAPLVLKHRRF